MVKIAVIGDNESIKGFAAVGLEIFPCERDEDAPALLKRVVDAGYGVLYITEHYATVLSKEIEKLNRQFSPSVVPIPGVSGNTGIGRQQLKAAVEKAVGSDIIFHS
ncbi:MAG: V-type ATP synthase subunit F [Clostridia bacterium]|nr:V-type ATP synthase subunit F [Clostridia bacterium]